MAEAEMSFAEWLRNDPLVDDPAYLIVLQDMGVVEHGYGLNRDSVHWSRRVEYPWAVLHAGLSSESVVLDAGGGPSSLQYYLSVLCRKVVNVDHDATALQQVEEKIKKYNIRNLIPFQGELSCLPYPNDYFDVVFCISTLEHCQPPHKPYLDEVMRVLKPGGRLMLTVDLPVFAKDPSLLDSHLIYEDAVELLKGYGVTVPPPEQLTVKLHTNFAGTYSAFITVLLVRIVKP